MARTSVTTQTITRAGLDPNLTGPPTGDGDIIDSGAVALWVDNGGGTVVTVTVKTPVEFDGLALADLTVSVPASGRRLIGPLPARVFQQPTDATTGASRVLVDYSAVASVTRAVVAF